MLGQFNYGRPSCTTDLIRECFGKFNNEEKWIYIGEVKGNRNDSIPHGIGIKVWSGKDSGGCT